MKKYIGVKLIQAEPMTRGAYNDYRGWQIPANENPEDDGYLVRYPDDYESWSPKDQFERYYFLLTAGYETRISARDVEAFIGEVTDTQIDAKTTLVQAELITGFIEHEMSSCVNHENYNHKLGVEIAARKIRDRLWLALGFVLQWAANGLKKEQFELHNRIITDMPFGHAIEAAKQGKKIARRGWNGRNMFVFLREGRQIQGVDPESPMGGDFESRPHLCMKDAQGKCVVGWLASQTDMLADDWYVVE